MFCTPKARSSSSRTRAALLPLLHAVLAVFASRAFAQTTSPVQATARPAGLSIVDTVKLAGSDDRAANFQNNALPSVLAAVNSTPNQRLATSPAFVWVDPARLNLTTAADVRAYFVGESTGWHDTLGFNTSGSSITSGAAKLIFPDASSNIEDYGKNSAKKMRDANNPLMAGDFVNLGNFSAGTNLDFFLISDGARNAHYSFSSDRTANPDGMAHVLTLALKDSPYLILGFEDQLGGGDRKFNDLLIAIDIGKANVRALTNAPEPALWLMLGSFLVIIGFYKKRAARRHKPCFSSAP